MSHRRYRVRRKAPKFNRWYNERIQEAAALAGVEKPGKIPASHGKRKHMPDDADWQQQEIEEMEDFWEFVDEKTGEFKEDSFDGGSPRVKLSPTEELGCALVLGILVFILYQIFT